MKVIIADDEVHICSLIKYLVAWDELGLTFSGMFYCGEEVWEYLQHDTADILICDIEMPGMNGIELMQKISQNRPEMKIIVISGFRDFDYARSAIKYGAANYLLKPIDEKELNDVLRAIVSSTREEMRRDSIIMRASGHQQLLEVISAVGRQEDMMAVNRDYDYHFVEGGFRVLRVAFPGEAKDPESQRLIMRMFEEILCPKLADFCREFEFYRESAVHLCVLFNYEDGNESTLQATLDGILHHTIVELGSKTQSEIYIGVGTAVHDFPDIGKSYWSARHVLCERLFQKERRILYAENSPQPQVHAELLTMEERRELGRCIETIDPDGACRQIGQILRRSERVFRANPYLVFDCGEAILQLLVHIMEHVGTAENDNGRFVAHSTLALEGSADMADFEQCLSEIVYGEINHKLTEKLANVSAYAQQAKEYIDRHYMENVTLETIAKRLNINPTYLSVVFKNEMKMNYNKYLTMVRMEKAKELLRQCDKNLTQVAHAVGYDRTAYFSNVFKMHMGIKPTEYQRLHQRGIGD